MKRENAEALALRALSWLISNDELRPVFIGSTGISEAKIRQSAAEPEFLCAVLEFLMLDDAWIVSFCETDGCPYTAPMEAKSALPGGAQVNWT